MLQRLGLAIALCGEPELLILDEPFNGLDPALLDVFQEVLRQEVQRGATLLISTHTISAVEPLATNVAVLLNGRLTAHDTTGGLRERFPDELSLEAVYRRIAREEELEAIAA
jgi:ABC-2 type transport system ATP-binding protein